MSLWSAILKLFPVDENDHTESCSRKQRISLYSGGSRISPRRGHQLPGGAPTYDFAKISQKLHEIERIWTGRGARVPCAPLRSATAICCGGIWGKNNPDKKSVQTIFHKQHTTDSDVIVQIGIFYQYKTQNCWYCGFVWLLHGIWNPHGVIAVHWSCRITQPRPQYLKVVSSLQLNFSNKRVNFLAHCVRLKTSIHYRFKFDSKLFEEMPFDQHSSIMKQIKQQS